MIVRIEPQQNIAIASVPDRDYAIKLIGIKSLQFGEKEYAVTAYAATPDNSGKGVIHGITPGTSARTLMEGLYAPGHAVLYARMLGTTHSALTTFEGEEVPFVVYYMDGEKHCYLYRSAKQVCQLCRTMGHCADVCPQPDVSLCAKCGTANPAQDHECTPKCALCQGEHLTAARDCPERYRNQSNKTADQRESRPTIRQPQNSSRAGTRSKSRSRSRQRSTSRARHIAAPGQQKSTNSQMETSLSQKLEQQLQLQEQCQMQQLQLFLHENLQEQLLAFREQLADNLPVKEKKRKKPKANSSVEDLDRSMENAPLPHDAE
ncbi:hypothetical protein HPB49_018481 [Dermacentor silvarum]|uniref:Uncharacterized protein n=1 Tax=Dermacentor silvarum TaxID=543639 RepID=A0ACB8CAS8_DERSI|nr:hypothetical protein HPB49_018481 [Dermacentor silvarum]